jgi:Type I phosphodiesterase / nucleotide pyrophosphatase
MTSETPARIHRTVTGTETKEVAGRGGAGPVRLPRPLVLPAYNGACLDSLAPSLLAPPQKRPDWLPGPLRAAEQVVLLLLDGLGWLQLQDRTHLTPTMASLDREPISSVAPTTTATALTSLALGVAPAAHGIVGYKFVVNGPSGREVLNVLRWSTRSGDARQFLPPRRVQPLTAFGGVAVPVVTKADFSNSGFTQAHQRGAREVPWHVPSSIPSLVRRLLLDDEALVYAYYDGVDRVAHATGLGELYDAELGFVDWLVGEMLSSMPPGTVLAVVADHGQVDVGPRAALVVPEVAAESELFSGEARFRWLHGRPGRAEALVELAHAHYDAEAWVATREEIIDTGVLGGVPSEEAIERLGDVALIPLGVNAYLDPTDAGDAKLVCRHGGLSPEEVLVPLLVARAS